MKAYQIQDAIIAARSSEAAASVWAEYYREQVSAAGPINEVSLDMLIDVEGPDGGLRPAPLRDVMPADGPGEIVAFVGGGA